MALYTANGLDVLLTLHVSSKIETCGPLQPSITLQDGRSFMADLLHRGPWSSWKGGSKCCAASGAYRERSESVLRPVISGEDIPISPSGCSAFRYLIAIDRVNANTITAPLVERSTVFEWQGKHHRRFIYPCR